MKLPDDKLFAALYIFFFVFMFYFSLLEKSRDTKLINLQEFLRERSPRKNLVKVGLIAVAFFFQDLSAVTVSIYHLDK